MVEVKIPPASSLDCATAVMTLTLLGENKVKISFEGPNGDQSINCKAIGTGKLVDNNKLYGKVRWKQYNRQVEITLKKSTQTLYTCNEIHKTN